MKRLGWILLCVLGAGVAHYGQRSADTVRKDHQIDDMLGMVPSGESLRWISMGFETQISDYMWIRSVLIFSDVEKTEKDEYWVEWLSRSLDVSLTLDPDWRTLYSYGSLMLKVAGDIQASNAVAERAMAVFPDDSYFAFSVGNNFHLYEEELKPIRFHVAVDYVWQWAKMSTPSWCVSFLDATQDSIERNSSRIVASMWLRHASTLPGAPAWYAKAASMFLIKGYDEKIAIQFLREQIKDEEDPVLLESLNRELMRQVHALRSEILTERMDAYLSRTGDRGVQLGMDATAISKGQPLIDPYERGWVLDVDDVVRSHTVVEELAARNLRYERRLLSYFPD